MSDILSTIVLLSENVTNCYSRNMGAYSYVNPRIMTATREINNDEKRPRYVGRKVSAAPATGMSKVHQAEYQAIMEAVYGNPEES